MNRPLALRHLGAMVMVCMLSAAANGQNQPRDLAIDAQVSTSYVSPHETLEAINAGTTPRRSDDHRHGAYGNWPRTGTQWVLYDWLKPITTDHIDVYWWHDGRGIALPTASRLQYWNGSKFAPVPGAAGLGIAADQFNTTRFATIITSRLRLEFDGDGASSTGILAWRVYDTGASPKFPPRVTAGPDRVVILPAKTYLNGKTRGEDAGLRWESEAGPGEVTFADPTAAVTTASFSAPGDYVLVLSATSDGLTNSDRLHVQVLPATNVDRLQPVYTRPYKIDSELWNGRLKSLMCVWIPHCIDEIDNPNLREGGIENFVQAGNKLAGKPYKPHVGAPFANAWVLNMVESMSVALQVDPQGNARIEQAQARMRATLRRWIPIILAAQEPDGYLQTRFTLGTPREVAAGKLPGHWTLRSEHEGYVAGYFLEAAIANDLLGDSDHRMYDAAKRLADCWYDHIGPAPKKSWYDGHEEMEQALVRFGRYVNDVEGAGKGDKYITLAKFLLDQRCGGQDYDQTQLPVVQQYQAVGHAVRAAYLYSGMADVAAETHDPDYQSAVQSLWDDLVNRKWYLTGGIGSGETSEGFGKDFSLPNNSYCESCSNCGALFFNWKMNLAYHQAEYADLYEQTLYNAILGDYDLSGQNYTYTNPLVSDSERYAWHTCPCCVGNFPRTLLMLPTWMYSVDANDLYVNLFVGSTVSVGKVGGTDVSVVQKTQYPWDGRVAIMLNPATPATFALRVRMPHRTVSKLYTTSDSGIDGMESLAVNGQPVAMSIENGYAVIFRQWAAGDTVSFELPLKPYRIKADERVAADRGRVAIGYGPLIYSVESAGGELMRDASAGAQQNPADAVSAAGPLTAQWRGDLLGGVVVIHGSFADGSPMTAVPNYARENRGGQSLVWMAEQ